MNANKMRNGEENMKAEEKEVQKEEKSSNSPNPNFSVFASFLGKH